MASSDEKPPQKYACTLCARRKVKCNKQEPCSNCSKSKTTCVYQAPPPPQRKKREADSDLLSKINQYEELLRKHEVPFDSYDRKPEFETDKKETWNQLPHFQRKQQQVSPPASTPSSEAFPGSERNSSILRGIDERSRWANLSLELQNPPMQSLKPTRVDTVEESLDADSFLLGSLSWSHNLIELHPEPRHIFRLWQVFLENVNPLTKIVHAPTLQQRIFEVSWNLQTIPKSTQAILFAIYTLAITSLSSTQCRDMFGEEKAILWKRFRAGTVQSLVAAKLITTKDLEVLQAFVLFLLAEPDSDETATLSAMAVRIGQKMGLHMSDPASKMAVRMSQKMGLHIPDPPPKISFFETEMRIRVWWQIRGLDARNARCRPNTNSLPRFPASEFGDIRLPLNVNDSSLHPDMVSPPVEHVGTTEMLYCLLKYEVGHWMKTNPLAVGLFKTGTPPTEAKDLAFNALERLYNEKYLRHCDPKIPLHALTIDISELALCRMRVFAHHPRKKADSGANMSVEEAQVLFENCVLLLELDEKCRKSPFSQQLLSHMTSRSQIDAMIYVLSELRYRSNGEFVTRAWNIISNIYEEHPELVEDTADTFYSALGDLTLEAWVCRQGALFNERGVQMDGATPAFIQVLASARQIGSEGIEALPHEAQFSTSLFPAQGSSQLQHTLPSSFNTAFQMPMGLECDPSGWGYWNEFLQL